MVLCAAPSPPCRAADRAAISSVQDQKFCAVALRGKDKKKKKKGRINIHLAGICIMCCLRDLRLA